MLIPLIAITGIVFWLLSREEIQIGEIDEIVFLLLFFKWGIISIWSMMILALTMSFITDYAIKNYSKKTNERRN